MPETKDKTRSESGLPAREAGKFGLDKLEQLGRVVFDLAVDLRAGTKGPLSARGNAVRTKAKY